MGLNGCRSKTQHRGEADARSPVVIVDQAAQQRKHCLKLDIACAKICLDYESLSPSQSQRMILQANKDFQLLTMYFGLKAGDSGWLIPNLIRDFNQENVGRAVNRAVTRCI
jgi:hypothetical protein